MMESSRTYTINNSKLTIKFGNIITSSADIIVSSDDYILSMEAVLPLQFTMRRVRLSGLMPEK